MPAIRLVLFLPPTTTATTTMKIHFPGESEAFRDAYWPDFFTVLFDLVFVQWIKTLALALVMVRDFSKIIASTHYPFGMNKSDPTNI